MDQSITSHSFSLVRLGPLPRLDVLRGLWTVLRWPRTHSFAWKRSLAVQLGEKSFYARQARLEPAC